MKLNVKKLQQGGNISPTNPEVYVSGLDKLKQGFKNEYGPIISLINNKGGNFGGGKPSGAGVTSSFGENSRIKYKTYETPHYVATENFNDVFKRAKNQGLNTFEFDGKQYTTDLGDNPNNNIAGANRIQVTGVIKGKTRLLNDKMNGKFKNDTINTLYPMELMPIVENKNSSTKKLQQGGKLIPKGQSGLRTNYVEPFNSPVNNNFNFIKTPVKIAEEIYIKDPRTIRATTNKKIRPTIDLKNDNYNKESIEKIIMAAQDLNFDPKTAIAVSLAESAIGKADENLGHVISKDIRATALSELEKRGQLYYPEDYKEAYTMIRGLQMKGDDARKDGKTDERDILQRYNGSWLYPDTESKYHKSIGKKGVQNKFYGVPVPKKGLNLNKNPLYGIEVINLRDSVVSKNPKILNMIDSITNPGYFQHFKYIRK